VFVLALSFAALKASMCCSKCHFRSCQAERKWGCSTFCRRQAPCYSLPPPLCCHLQQNHAPAWEVVCLGGASLCAREPTGFVCLSRGSLCLCKQTHWPLQMASSLGTTLRAHAHLGAFAGCFQQLSDRAHCRGSAQGAEVAAAEPAGLLCQLADVHIPVQLLICKQHLAQGCSVRMMHRFSPSEKQGQLLH
jgi:hypothetical protein